MSLDSGDVHLPSSFNFVFALLDYAITEFFVLTGDVMNRFLWNLHERVYMGSHAKFGSDRQSKGGYRSPNVQNCVKIIAVSRPARWVKFGTKSTS